MSFTSQPNSYPYSYGYQGYPGRREKLLVDTQRSNGLLTGLVWLLVISLIIGGVVIVSLHSGSRREMANKLRKEIQDLKNQQRELRLHQSNYENQFAQLRAESSISVKAQKLGLRLARPNECTQRMKIVRSLEKGWMLEQHYLGMK